MVEVLSKPKKYRCLINRAISHNHAYILIDIRKLLEIKSKNPVSQKKKNWIPTICIASIRFTLGLVILCYSAFAPKVAWYQQ